MIIGRMIVFVVMVGCGPLVRISRAVAVPSSPSMETEKVITDCQRTRAPQCQGLPANLTFSRSVDQDTLDTYEWLLQTNCSPDLAFLICTVHSQVCSPEKPEAVSLPPCRSVCRQVRTACLPHVKENKLSRPEALRCKGLPRHNCITPDSFLPAQRRTECNCKSQEEPLKSKLYGSKHFDYAIRGTFKSAEGIVPGPMVLYIQVKEVLKYTQIPINPHSTITMWVGTGCICPHLEEGAQYLMLGYEDSVYSRLLFNERSVAVSWRDRWRTKIRKWERRARAQKRRRLSNHSEKRRRNREKKQESKEQQREFERQRRREERERQRHGEAPQSRSSRRREERVETERHTSRNR